jgi:hypothetical protein
MKEKITYIFLLLFQYISYAQSPTSFYLNETSLGGNPIYTEDHIYFQYNSKLVKTDYQGNVIWDKSGLPSPIFQGNVFYGLSYLSNSFYISKCDTAGNFIWTKNITPTVCPHVANHYNTIRGVVVNQDRIYISSGQYTTSTGYDGANAMLTLDTSGNVIHSWCDPTMWPSVFSFISNGFPSFMPGCWITFDYPGVGYEKSLVKLNYDGTINTTIQANYIEMGFSVSIDNVLLLPDSNYLAVCRVDNNQMGGLHDIFFGLSKFTENGTVLWQKTFQSVSDTAVYCGGATNDTLGNIYLMGGKIDPDYIRTDFGMKLDPNGNIDFIKEWNDTSITSKLELFNPKFKDDQIICAVHYTDAGQKHEGIMVFDTLFESCMMSGVPYSITPIASPIASQTFPAYNAIGYSAITDTLLSVNGPGTFPNDLCIPLGISQIESVSDITLYPNPFQSSITFSGNSEGVVIIYDLSGKKLFESQVEAKEEIDLEFLSKGIYQLTFTSDSKIINGKIVKI